MLRKLQKSSKPEADTPASPTQELAQIKRTLTLLKRFIYGAGGLIAIGLAAWGVAIAYRHFVTDRPAPNPVPAAIQKSVNFSIYYPDQKKLPAGYTLDKSSFSGNTLAVVYSIRYGNNQKLTFSVQQKPSASEIQSFYTSHLPLRTTVNTHIGTAAVGAIGTKTIVSLPTNTNAWILMTGASDIDQTKLSQVLQAMQLSR